jgi:hypothetical protein
MKIKWKKELENTKYLRHHVVITLSISLSFNPESLFFFFLVPVISCHSQNCLSTILETELQDVGEVSLFSSVQDHLSSPCSLTACRGIHRKLALGTQREFGDLEIMKSHFLWKEEELQQLHFAQCSLGRCPLHHIVLKNLNNSKLTDRT